MAKRLAIIGIFSLAVGMIVDARTAWGFQLTCSGYLTNTREVGVTLDKCDLNARFGSWLRENSGARATRRNISEQLHL
jgi:hypothetical protein